MSKTITLPLPSAKLSANARVHRMAKAAITKRHRQSAAHFAFQQIDRVPMAGYKLVFYWPNKIRRDKRNAAERCKAYEDGISDYLGQDDSQWEFYGVEFGEPDKANPRVEFHFTTIEEAEVKVDELAALRKDRARLEWVLGLEKVWEEIGIKTRSDIDEGVEIDKRMEARES